MDWQTFVNNADLHGDIESQESGNIYRGPIKSIAIDGDTAVIQSEWMATMPAPGQPGRGGWKLWHVVRIPLQIKNVELTEIGDGRVMWRVPMLGPFVIFPKSGSRLDPRKVEGHPDYDPNFVEFSG